MEIKTETSLVVLTLDLSMKNTGWALGDMDGVQFGAVPFTVKAGVARAIRFVAFRAWIRVKLDEEQPDLVIYEESDPRRMPSGQAVNCAVGLRTVLEMECATRAIQTRQMMPNALKKVFTGCGKATKGDKSAMKAAAAARFAEYNPQLDPGGDMADALALLWVWQNKPEVFEPKPKKPRLSRLSAKVASLDARD